MLRRLTKDERYILLIAAQYILDGAREPFRFDAPAERKWLESAADKLYEQVGE